MSRIELVTRIAAPPERCFDLSRSLELHMRSDHFFEAAPGGGTTMRDVFDYRAPLGPLGRIAERTILDPYLRRFLLARNAEIKAIAESRDWERYIPRVLSSQKRREAAGR
ncbi:MAG: hypothetical protein ACJ784_03790 [Myxococcales bacterium]